MQIMKPAVVAKKQRQHEVVSEKDGLATAMKP